MNVRIFHRFITFLFKLLSSNWTFFFGIWLGLVFMNYTLQDYMYAIENFKSATREIDHTEMSLFDPVHHPVNKNKLSKSISHFKRYIHAKDELNMRRKLFIGILTTSETIHNRAIPLHKSLHNDKFNINFYVSNTNISSIVIQEPGFKLTHLPSGIRNPSVAFLQMVKMMIDRGDTSRYDFYLLTVDSSYVRLHPLLRRVVEVNVAHTFCLLDHSGLNKDAATTVLLSRKTMYDFVLKWGECTDLTMSACLQRILRVTCQSQLPNLKFSSIRYDQTNFQNNKTCDYLLVKDVPNAQAIYRLHRYFTIHDIEQNLRRIQQLKEDIADVRVEPRYRNITFPLGVVPRTFTRSLYAMLHWRYFNDTHNLLDSEQDVISLNDETELIEIAELKEMIAKQETSRSVEVNSVEVKDIVNGYSRFDPVRGIEYLMDVTIRNTSTGRDVVKRFQILRPLGEPRLVKHPFVTETYPLTIIVHIEDDTKRYLKEFLAYYLNTCDTQRSKVTTSLIVVMLASQHSDVDYSHQIDQLTALKARSTRIAALVSYVTSIVRLPSSGDYDQTLTISALRLDPLTPVLLLDVMARLNRNFLNRAHIQTARGRMAYFPIAFRHYNNDIVGQRLKYNNIIHPKFGFFDYSRHDISAFYIEDFNRCVSITTDGSQQQRESSPKPYSEIFDHFVACPGMHAFTAVEPSLVLRYRPRVCHSNATNTPPHLVHACRISRDKNLAEKARLAMYVMRSK